MIAKTFGSCGEYDSKKIVNCGKNNRNTFGNCGDYDSKDFCYLL